MDAMVAAVCRSEGHTMAKAEQPEIRLLAGLGVEGDAHAGVTVKEWEPTHAALRSARPPR